jgi:hypothetical protein
MIVRRLSILLATLRWIAPGLPAQAENEWTLWERQLDGKGQPGGEWRRKRGFETERWCKGAMTTTINETLMPKEGPAAGAKRKLFEYQCLPGTVDPAAPKSSR